MKFHPRFRLLGLALLASASLPAVAAAQTFTVTDISVAGPEGSTFAIPSIEVTNSNLDEAAVRALFSGTFDAAAGAIATLDAAKVVIPEISITMAPAAGGGALAGGPTVTRYLGLELTNVVDGVAEAARVESTEISGGSPQTTATLGAMSSGLLDFGGILGFYGIGPQTTGTEMKPIYRDFRLESISFGGPGFSCAIGPMTAGEFSSRPLKGNFAQLMGWTQEIEAAETGGTPPSSEAIAGLVAYYADMFTAFRSSPSAIEGLDCSGTDDTGAPVKVTAGTMGIGAFEPGIYPEINLADLRVEVGSEGSMGFDSFIWKKSDLNGPIAAVLAAGADINEAWFEANWRQLIPALDGLSLTGLSIDLPNNEAGGGQRIQASVGAFDVSLADYVNGIPAAIATTGTDIAITVPNDDDGAALRALGIDKLNLDYDLDLRWDETSRTIAVERVAIAGDELGAITLSGTLANAGPELFHSDPAVAQAAAMGVTITSLTIDLENGGIAPLLIASAAAEQGQPPESLQVAVAGMAQAMPLAFLGATPDALAVSEALGKFLNGTPNLSITVTSVDPNGIGLAEFMAAESDPTVLKDKVKIVASASGEPVTFVYPEIAAPAQPAAPTTPETQPAPEATPPAETPSSRDEEKTGGKN